MHGGVREKREQHSIFLGFVFLSYFFFPFSDFLRLFFGGAVGDRALYSCNIDGLKMRKQKYVPVL